MYTAERFPTLCADGTVRNNIYIEFRLNVTHEEFHGWKNSLKSELMGFVALCVAYGF